MPSVDDTILCEVFRKYCNFGSRHSSLGGDSPRRNFITSPQMEGSKFAKLTREAGLIDGQVITLTEVDILFSRVKDKTERKISFLQFRTALKLLAEKKYAAEECTAEEVEERVLKVVRNLGGPQITAGTTLPNQSQMIDRLMEGPTNYISKSPKDEARSWKDDLRRSPSSPASRRTSNVHSPLSSRKSSLNPAGMAASQLPSTSCEHSSPSKTPLASAQ